jgi:tRNA (guanine26-N2/guanine27-N2)-dimethyltransferase
MPPALDLDTKSQDFDAKSILSMQELDPSPVDDSLSTPELDSLENGEYFPKPAEDKPARTCGFPAPKLGLRAHRWDTLRKYNWELSSIGTQNSLTITYLTL